MVAELDRQAEGGGGGPRVGLVAVALPFSGGSFELQLPPPVTMVAAGVAAGLSFVQQRAAGGLLGAPGRCFPPANQQQFASSSPAASSVITRRGRDKVKRALRAVTASDWKSTVLGAVELTGLLASAGQLMSPKVGEVLLLGGSVRTRPGVLLGGGALRRRRGRPGGPTQHMACAKNRQARRLGLGAWDRGLAPARQVAFCVLRRLCWRP